MAARSAGEGWGEAAAHMCGSGLCAASAWGPPATDFADGITGTSACEQFACCSQGAIHMRCREHPLGTQSAAWAWLHGSCRRPCMHAAAFVYLGQVPLALRRTLPGWGTPGMRRPSQHLHWLCRGSLQQHTRSQRPRSSTAWLLLFRHNCCACSISQAINNTWYSPHALLLSHRHGHSRSV